MDRWSARLPDGRAVHAGFGLELPKGDPWERIAAYEDTGLTPEGITALLEKVKYTEFCAKNCLEYKQEIDTLKKALKLAEDMLTKMTPYKSKGGWHGRLIQKAQEQEGEGMKAHIVKKQIVEEKRVLVHGGMKYRCESCGKSWFMSLEIGVEDFGKHGRPHQPAPFMIQCDCGGFAQDISGYIPFPEVRPLFPGMRYFAYDRSGKEDACGQPSLYKPKEATDHAK